MTFTLSTALATIEKTVIFYFFCISGELIAVTICGDELLVMSIILS